MTLELSVKRAPITDDMAKLVPVVKDFPRPGIDFRDISPLLADPQAFKTLLADLALAVRQAGATTIVGLESRGFIIGAALALALEVPFIAARKAGKLPGATVSTEYALEYGHQKLELQVNAPVQGARVAVVDDLLATGGTVSAAAKLIEELGGEVVGYFFAIELKSLNGRDKLSENVYATLSL
jgi:adenine phosphoribosyltransferase